MSPVPVQELSTETSIAIRWNSINCIDQNGPMITYEARLNNGAVIITTSGSRAIFSDLNPLTNYTIDVRTLNSQGAGPFSSVLRVATNISGFSGIGLLDIIIYNTQNIAIIIIRYIMKSPRM